MMKIHLCLLVFYLLVSPSTSFSQIKSFDPETTRICTQAQLVELPAKERPNAAEVKALQDCDSQDLYFGLNKPADPLKARKCAYLEMEKGGMDLTIRGRGLLVMVYANGKGAEQNLDIALRLACEMPGAPQDIAGSVHALDRLKGAHLAENHFSICDHSSGPLLYKECAILEDKFDRVRREEKLNALIAKWPAQDRSAFQELRQAAERFFKARAGNEIDLSHTVEVHEIALLENEFIEKIQLLERGELPSFTREQSRRNDAGLDAKLSKLDKAEISSLGTVTPEGLKSAQRLWLAYRDAWITFGRWKYPTVSPDSWNAWLTEERQAMILRSMP